jgi:tripartite-type tricarboxylate transporter receptor subunit TctC
MKKLVTLFLAVMMVLVTFAALADWPERAIELIVPANPGGDTDANARALAAALTEEMGWDVIVTNMNGGAGAVAFEDVISNPDPGYRFVFYHSGACITQIMGMYEGYNILEDFKLAGMPVLDYSNAFVINAQNSKFSDVASMVEYMKAHPNDVTFATETGSFTHLHVLAFEQAAGVSFNIVDAGTAAQKTTELLGQRLDVIGTQAGLVRDYLDTTDPTQKFTCLGILADERLAARPDIPTMKEQGYDVVFSKFFYLAAPNAVDDAVITAMNEGLQKAIANKTFLSYCENAYVNPTYMTPEDTEKYYGEQYDLYLSFLGDYAE